MAHKRRALDGPPRDKMIQTRDSSLKRIEARRRDARDRKRIKPEGTDGYR